MHWSVSTRPTLQSVGRGHLGLSPQRRHKLPDDVGDQWENDDWKSQSKYNGHRDIPLASADMMIEIPMISLRLTQFGIDPARS